MYGWMTQHVLGRGAGEPVSEGRVRRLSQTGERSVRDPGHNLIAQGSAVIEQRARAPEKPSPRSRVAGGALVPPAQDNAKPLP
jgi:hypothetical protein